MQPLFEGVAHKSRKLVRIYWVFYSGFPLCAFLFHPFMLIFNSFFIFIFFYAPLVTAEGCRTVLGNSEVQNFLFFVLAKQAAFVSAV